MYSTRHSSYGRPAAVLTQPEHESYETHPETLNRLGFGHRLETETRAQLPPAGPVDLADRCQEPKPFAGLGRQGLSLWGLGLPGFAFGASGLYNALGSTSVGGGS